MINMCDIYENIFEALETWLSEPFTSRVKAYQEQFKDLEQLENEQLIIE